MMLAARGAFLAARRKPKPPYDAEVEYLESTGTQWIDTGVQGTTDIDFRIDAQMTQTGTFGFCGFGSGLWLVQFRALYQFSNYPEYETSSSYKVSIDSTLRHVYDCGAAFSIDGVVYHRPNQSAITEGRSLFLFGINRGWVGSIAKMRCYSFAVSTGGVLRRDMIPVRFTNEQGVSEGAMYDRANPTVGMDPDGSPRTDGLYRNRGTGAFVIGADKTA